MSGKHPLKTVILFLFFVFAVFAQANAQQKDSLAAQPNDTAKKVHKVHPYPNPAKAMLYSAIIPGAGQFYNKRYWKIPIIYAALGTCAYFIVWNNNQYLTYYNALNIRNNGGQDQFYNIYPKSYLVDAQQYYQHYFWLSVIGAGLVYILNVVDANVDAQLHNFDVSDKLSINLAPQLYNNPMNGKYSIQPGLCLVKRF